MRIPLLLNGPLIVTSEFCRSREPAQPEGAQVEYDGTGDEPNWDDIKAGLQTSISSTAGTRASSDATTAEIVHRLLPLSRRQAANRRFWHFATVRLFSDYVTWRWWNESECAVPRPRYLGPINRNALARLWWLAELTLDAEELDPYHITRKAGSHSEFFQWCVDTLVCANRAASRALVHAVFDSDPPLNDNEIKALFKAVNGHLATHVLDVYDEDSIIGMVMNKVRDGQNQRDAYPVESAVAGATLD